ncbi:MAG: hypothetical protein LBV00_01645 [Propionibacteriaceae bacterium]|jgi:protein-tyrosine phosphatase|nr:hypothetical protein [Propionibacteriaceae bacterium]
MTTPGRHILAVCTGNICRSPSIERLLDLRLAGSHQARSEFTVASAGTGAVTGAPIESTMADLLTRAGVDTADFRAQPVTMDLVDQADLILTATAAHRATIVRLAPKALARTFTLVEFALSLTHISPTDVVRLPLDERLPHLLANARQCRPALRSSGQAIDITDPYRQPFETYQAAFVAIQQAVDPIAQALIDTVTPL